MSGAHLADWTVARWVVWTDLQKAEKKVDLSAAEMAALKDETTVASMAVVMVAQWGAHLAVGSVELKAG